MNLVLFGPLLTSLLSFWQAPLIQLSLLFLLPHCFPQAASPYLTGLAERGAKERAGLHGQVTELHVCHIRLHQSVQRDGICNLQPGCSYGCTHTIPTRTCKFAPSPNRVRYFQVKSLKIQFQTWLQMQSTAFLGSAGIKSTAFNKALYTVQSILAGGWTPVF